MQVQICVSLLTTVFTQIIFFFGVGTYLLNQLFVDVCIHECVYVCPLNFTIFYQNIGLASPLLWIRYPTSTSKLFFLNLELQHWHLTSTLTLTSSFNFKLQYQPLNLSTLANPCSAPARLVFFVHLNCHLILSNVV